VEANRLEPGVVIKDQAALLGNLTFEHLYLRTEGGNGWKVVIARIRTGYGKLTLGLIGKQAYQRYACLVRNSKVGNNSPSPVNGVDNALQKLAGTDNRNVRQRKRGTVVYGA
jgi:hypothetical protein